MPSETVSWAPYAAKLAGSEGEHIGNYNAGGVSLGQDAYDFIEWVAAQPWCDGSVGMIGISYLYLRPRGKLSFEPEAMGVTYAPPDGFFQAPLTVTDKVEILSWSTEPFQEPIEMIGTGAAYIFTRGGVCGLLPSRRGFAG